jgi:hypothetical protein
MKRHHFLLITAGLSFVFGVLLFFVPHIPAALWGIPPAPLTITLLRGLGGLIIGFGMVNFLLRRHPDAEVITVILWTDIGTNLLGLAADCWGVSAGALDLAKMASVELTHLFIMTGSALCLMTLARARRIKLR